MSLIKQEKVRNSPFNFSALLRGTLYAIVLSVLGSGVMGMVYFLTSLSESTLPWLASSILFLSVMVGGGAAARKVGSNGLYHGLGVGIMFFLLSLFLALVFLPATVLFIPMLQKLLLALAAGALGGMLGVGLAS